jgi:ribosome-associated protein
MLQGKQLADRICEIIYEKKGQDIMVIDVAELTIVAEHFVICHGSSTPHVKALAEELEEKMEKEGYVATRKDGLREGRWAVMDYGNVIVHIFNRDERLIYDLEALWSNGENCRRYPNE